MRLPRRVLRWRRRRERSSVAVLRPRAFVPGPFVVLCPSSGHKAEFQRLHDELEHILFGDLWAPGAPAESGPKRQRDAGAR